MTELRGDTTKLRVFAMMIDNFVATVIFVIVIKLLFAASGEDADYMAESFYTPAAVGTFAYLFYFFVQEWIWGATLGKFVFGLRVARLDGKPVGIREAGSRTLSRIYEVNPVLLGAIPGGLVIMGSRRRQRMGDMLAGTVVMRRKVLESVRAESRAQKT